MTPPSDPDARSAAVSAAPPNAAEQLFGVRITGHAPGHITGTADVPASELLAAVTPLGYFGTLLDVCAGRSVRTRLHESLGCRTANLRIDAAGDFPARGEVVQAHAEALETFAGTVLARVRLTTAEGRVVARCTGRFGVVPEEPDWIAAPVRSSDVLTRLLADLAGVRDSTESKLILAPELANQYGIMHGGVQAFLSGAVLRNLAHGAVGDDLRPLDLTVRYHRPVVVSDAPLTLAAAVERRGRRLVVAGTQGFDETGKALFTARATFGRF